MRTKKKKTEDPTNAEPWIDPIVEEVRKIREEHAARFDYDLKRIFQDMKEQEEKHGHKVVTLPPKRIKAEAKE